MKILLIVTLLAYATLGEENVQSRQQQTRAMLFTYQAGATAAYPVGTGVIYSPGTAVDHIAGVTLTYVYNVRVQFPRETEIYTANGPITYAANTDVSIPGGAQLTYGPGTSVVYQTMAETRYGQFNGNTHAIANYPEQTNVQYYYGPNGSNLILYPADSNPLVFYNPGGSTRFGPSALPVEKDPEANPESSPNPAVRTYGYYNRGGGSGYSYCSGYSSNGYPRTTYCGGGGYRSYCQQSCYNCYSYSNNGGGGGTGGGGTGTGTGGGGSYGK